MARRDYAGGAVATTITGSINATALTIPIAASTGWPVGTNGKFYVVIDKGLATEEKVLVTSRSGLNLTVASTGDRGADGTTAQSHSSGATIEHCLASPDVDEPNAHINDTAHLSASNIAGAGLGITSGVLAVNVDGSSLEISSDTLRVKAAGITSAMILDATIATGDLADGAVTYAKVQDVSATDRLLGRDTAAAGDIEELTVGGGLEFTGSGGIQRSALTGDVTASAGSGATTLAAGAVTAAKLASGLHVVTYVANAAARAALSPTAGDLVHQLDTGVLYQYYSATTGWQPASWQNAWGTVAAARLEADYPNIVTVADVTNLVLTWTPVRNRRYKLSAEMLVETDTAGSGLGLTITNSAGSTQYQQRNIKCQAATFSEYGAISWFNTVDLGSSALTFKVRAVAISGIGAIRAGATYPATFIAEDIGPLAAPV